MKQCVCKGWHFSFPRKAQLRRNRTKLSVEFTLTPEGFAYDLPGEDVDQGDLIKIDGLYFFGSLFKVFNTRYVTDMISGRYDPHTKQVDLTFYYHDGSTTPIYNLDNKFSFVLDEEKKFIFTISREGQIFYNELSHNGEKVLEDIREFNTLVPKWSNRINLYFGGNEKAPNRVCVEK